MTKLPQTNRFTWMLISLFLASYCVHAAVPSVTLKQLVRDSERIIVGTVSETTATEIKDPSDGQLYVATIEVVTAIRGPKGGTVDIAYFPRSSVYPRFAQGDHVIVFAQRSRSDGRIYAAAGPRGVVQVRDGKVTTAGISGEPEQQEIDAFVAAIRRALGR